MSHVKWSWAWCGGEPQDTITFDTLDGGSSGAVVGGGAGEGHRVLADGRWGLRERCRDLAFVAIKDDGSAVSSGVARGPGQAVELANRQVDLVIQEGEALLTARYTSLNSGLGIETGRRSTGGPKTFSAANMCFSAADALEDDSCLHSVSVDAGGTVIRNHDPCPPRGRLESLISESSPNSLRVPPASSDVDDGAASCNFRQGAVAWRPAQGQRDAPLRPKEIGLMPRSG